MTRKREEETRADSSFSRAAISEAKSGSVRPMRKRIEDIYFMPGQYLEY
jgi:hypothetical protein